MCNVDIIIFHRLQGRDVISDVFYDEYGEFVAKYASVIAPGAWDECNNGDLLVIQHVEVDESYRGT